jgi:asparagine synthase (glutamine-hydrolysing)
MCGIAGILSLSHVALPESAATLERMVATLTHRGPDYRKVVAPAGGWYAIGHSRLKIIDLSANGNQPMSNETGKIWIVFNGEIYNFSELRSQLQKAGHRFSSRSDTEVVVHLYEEYGLNCLDYLDGDFAFCIVDSENRRALIARDPFGVKPLYYSIQNGHLVFGSEIKAILRHPSVHKSLSLDGLNAYLVHNATTAPHTLFDGIHKLAPGERIVMAGSDLRMERYYDLAGRVKDKHDLTVDEATERIRQLIVNAVKKRMMSDVPFGAFLSGGVDSSTIAAIMADLHTAPLHTFSASFAGDKKKELSYAGYVAELFKTEHHEVVITEDQLIDGIKQIAAINDDPVNTHDSILSYYISRNARQHGIVVMESGEGADELFWGYQSYYKKHNRLSNKRLDMRLIRTFTRSRAFGRFIHLSKYVPADRIQTFLMNLFSFLASHAYYTDFEENFSYALKGRLLNTSQTNRVDGQNWHNIDGIQWDKIDTDQFMYLYYENEVNTRMTELLLMRTDKMTMANSVEARVPFLDKELIEFILTLPTEMRLGNGVTKSLLKRAMTGTLPERIINRQKVGFGGGAYNTATPGVRSFMRRRLLEQDEFNNFFNFDFIQYLLDENDRTNGKQYVWQLWNLLFLKLWYQNWMAG